jgi:ABC-type multidrug transport system permease subunit
MYELVIAILTIIIFIGFYIFILGFTEDNDEDDLL